MFNQPVMNSKFTVFSLLLSREETARKLAMVLHNQHVLVNDYVLPVEVSNRMFEGYRRILSNKNKIAQYKYAITSVLAKEPVRFIFDELFETPEDITPRTK